MFECNEHPNNSCSHRKFSENLKWIVEPVSWSLILYIITFTSHSYTNLDS